MELRISPRGEWLKQREPTLVRYSSDGHHCSTLHLRMCGGEQPRQHRLIKPACVVELQEFGDCRDVCRAQLRARLLRATRSHQTDAHCQYRHHHHHRLTYSCHVPVPPAKFYAVFPYAFSVVFARITSISWPWSARVPHETTGGGDAA